MLFTHILLAASLAAAEKPRRQTRKRGRNRHGRLGTGRSRQWNRPAEIDVKFHKGVSSENMIRDSHGQCRFLLLATQRSGTHYVMHELRRHSQIFTYDEIFYKLSNTYRPTWGAQDFRKGLDIYFGVKPWEPKMIDGRWGLEQKLKTNALEPGAALGITARGATVQYNQGPQDFWDTFSRGVAALNISVVHLVRRDAMRAEISNFFLNNPRRKCVPLANAATVFQAAQFRLKKIREFQALVHTLKARTLEVEYETLLKDPQRHFHSIYKFLGLREPPPSNVSKTQKLHGEEIPWFDYIGRYNAKRKREECPWQINRGKMGVM